MIYFSTMQYKVIKFLKHLRQIVSLACLACTLFLAFGVVQSTNLAPVIPGLCLLYRRYAWRVKKSMD